MAPKNKKMPIAQNPGATGPPVRSERKYLDTPMPRTFVNLLRKHPRDVEVEYVEPAYPSPSLVQS